MLPSTSYSKAARICEVAANKARDPKTKKELRQLQRTGEILSRSQSRKEGSSSPAPKCSPSS